MYTGHTRALLDAFVHDLGERLVRHGALTRGELEGIERTEHEITPEEFPSKRRAS